MIGEAVATLGVTPFAIVDVETTGIYAGGNDRIIEIAVVRTDPSGAFVEEYVTLVNPGRDVGSTPIHGIMASDIVCAPFFEEIAGDVANRLDGAILVGHNLQFDLRFLETELSRCGVAVPSMPAICTLRLAFRICPSLPSRKLRSCCEEVGIQHVQEHSALADARATAGLLAVYLQRAASKGWSSLSDLGCEIYELPHKSWIGLLRPSGRYFCRTAASERAKQERTYLASLVERLPGNDATDARTAEYMALLDRALEDRDISHHEAQALVSAATSCGMTKEDVFAANRIYLASLVANALNDGVVTTAERRDLEAVCQMLGLNNATLDDLLSGSSPVAVPSSFTVAKNFAGKTVCFTGEFLARINGEAITREKAEELATGAGLIVKNGVTKKLDLLVCADSHSQSGKAKKARQYGVRIMSEPAFWRAIGVNVE
ncbi:DNA polymerase III [bacterium]|nr:DNA polymerase III [bacterium]